VALIPLAGLTFFRGRDGYKNLIIFIYNCCICILLIRANSTMYICYIFCGGGMEICVLTVIDNEHDSEHTVGDDAEGVTAWEMSGHSRCCCWGGAVAEGVGKRPSFFSEPATQPQAVPFSDGKSLTNADINYLPIPPA
jgi:hypothetical protein